MKNTGLFAGAMHYLVVCTPIDLEPAWFRGVGYQDVIRIVPGDSVNDSVDHGGRLERTCLSRMSDELSGTNQEN